MLTIIRVIKTEQDVVVNLVNKMLELNKKLIETPTNAEDWLSTKSEIEKVDKLIDQEVYRLYGLDMEEIDIVEKDF